MYEHIFEQLDQLDWSDVAAIARDGDVLLRQLSHRDVLTRLIASVCDSPVLFSLCEHKPFQDKLVLHKSDASGVSVRMHVFLPGHADRTEWIHDHRWSFVSRILAGSYVQTLYRLVSDCQQDAAAGPLEATASSRLEVGASYALHHSAFHSIRAEAHSVSLLIRGPTEKRCARFLRIDGAKTFSHQGVMDETPEQRAQKSMSRDRFEAIRQILHDQDLL